MRIPYPIYEAIERYSAAFAEYASRPGESLDSCAECREPVNGYVTKEHLCAHLDSYTFPIELFVAALGERPAVKPEALREHLVAYLRSELNRDDRPGEPDKLARLVKLRPKLRVYKERKPRESTAMTAEQKLNRLKNIHVRYTSQRAYDAKIKIDPATYMVIYKWASPVEAFSCCCLDKIPEPYKTEMGYELARLGLTTKTVDGVDYSFRNGP